MPSHKTSFRIILSALMTIIVIGLLLWQDARYRLVGDCHANGGQWDGATSRCRPIPKVYIERGLKRT